MPLLRLSLLTLLMLALVLLALPPSRAVAGSYDVYACNGSPGGSASFVGSADFGLSAYHECGGGEGAMIARNGVDGGASSGFLQGAFQIFDAPAGTWVESIHFEARTERPDCRWGTQVVASNGDLGGQFLWGMTPSGEEKCGVYGSTWLRADLPVNASRVRFETRCGSGTCSRAGKNGIWARNVRVHVRDDVGPNVGNARGALWSGGWMSGSRDVAFDASDGAGIRETIVRIDGQELKRNAKACDYTQRAPCPNEGFNTTIETAAIKPDGAHKLALEAVDAGGNAGRVERDVLIDNTPPAQPVDLTLGDGEDWRAENDFDLSWKNPVEKGVAPIVGVEYEICPVSGGSCTRGQRSGKDITKLDDLKVPAPGEHVLKVWLRDEAGNHDIRTAAAPVRLRFDDFAPDLAFEPLDPADPTLLKVKSIDRGSGVAQAQIEVKPRNSSTWYPLETKIESQRLTARLADEYMKDGVYDLRARAVDHAANERTSDARSDGSRAEVMLPIRLKTSLRVGIKRRGTKRVRYRSRARIRYGRPVRINGRLTTRDRNPIQDAEVLVFSQARRAGAPLRLVATLKTSRLGGFSYRAPKGVSRTIRFRYGGTANVRSATRDMALLVRARSTIRPSRRSFVNGETMRLRGKLRGGSVPPEGKLVELQVLIRGRWRTFATTRASRRGRWRYDYRFDGTRGRQTYRFRARIPREATYPYESGLSRVVKVRVRGL